MFKKPKKGMVKPMKRAFVYLLTFLFLLPCLAFASSIKAGAEGYATPDMLDGTDNLFLSYTFNHSYPASGHRSKEGYKPLVGYYDTEGKVRDIFFDSFLFLPCVTTAPSGGSIYRDSKNPSNFSDWQMFVDDCFLDGYNIPALNQAVGEVKAGDAKPVERSFDLYRHGVEIRLEGSYGQLQAYLAQLEKLQQKLLWGKLEYRVIDYPKAELTLTVYPLSPDRTWLAL